MSTAKDLEKTWFYFTTRAKNEQVNHLLTNCKEFIIHEVNKLKVFGFSNHFEVINEESKNLKFFDTEQEALNYCLDYYHDTKINEQINLFD